MTQEEVTALLGSVPAWATESTLDSLNGQSTTNNITMTQVAAILGKPTKDLIDSLNRKAEKLHDKAQSSQDKIISIGKKTSLKFNQAIGNTDPVNAVAELSHETAKLLANAGIGLAKFTSGIKGVGTAINVMQKTVGTSLVIGTGMGVIFAKLLTEQEKQTRQLVDFGSLVADQQLWTSLRSSTRSLGMGLKDYTEMADTAKPFLLKATGDVFSGQLSLSNFIDNIDQDKTFMDFGLTVQDQSRFITQETETLYQLGQITEINNATKQRVMDAFDGANKLALFTGNSLGLQRTEALRLREEARTHVGLQTALIQNAEVITNEFGENASKNIADAAGLLNVLNTATFGEDFATSFQTHLSGTVGDFPYDKVAVNNINTEFLEKMNMISPKAAEAYIALVEDTAQGKLGNPEEVANAQRNLVQIVRDATTKISAFHPLLHDVNMLIAEATLIPDSYFTADTAKLSDKSYFADLAEAADDNIDVIDDLSVTFQQIQEIITPSYKTMSIGFKSLSGILMNFGKGLSKLFGDDAAERFDELYQIDVNEANMARLSLVNRGNILPQLEALKRQIDGVEAGKVELKEYDVAGINDAGDAFDKEEQFAILAQLDQLEDQLMELENYQTMLLEKKNELFTQPVGVH
tara:strand:- start:520 stop:2430 length:1911 start_codon:yes stop_codon:yes gene_type:complete